MTDRNLRRLLYALRSTQLREKVFLVLKRIQMPAMTNCDLELINRNAAKYALNYPDSGQKMSHQLKRDLNAILGSLSSQEQAMTEQMLEAFGVTVIWVDSYEQIPEIVAAVSL